MLFNSWFTTALWGCLKALPSHHSYLASRRSRWVRSAWGVISTLCRWYPFVHLHPGLTKRCCGSTFWIPGGCEDGGAGDRFLFNPRSPGSKDIPSLTLLGFLTVLPQSKLVCRLGGSSWIHGFHSKQQMATMARRIIAQILFLHQLCLFLNQEALHMMTHALLMSCLEYCITHTTSGCPWRAWLQLVQTAATRSVFGVPYYTHIKCCFTSCTGSQEASRCASRFWFLPIKS